MDSLVDGLGVKYANMILAMKDKGFEQHWKNDLLPVVLQAITENEERNRGIDFTGLLKDIQKLKQCAPIENVKIYMSALSFPVAFTLYNNAFLMDIGGWDIAIVAHELMHGFASQEVTDLYIKHVESDEYLKAQHRRLIDEMSSGNEEEFVAAAEYYLHLKHGGEDVYKPSLLDCARTHYDGCMPTSVFLFDLLSQESETPSGYDDWLKDVFTSDKLSKTNVEAQLEEIAPIR